MIDRKKTFNTSLYNNQTGLPVALNNLTIVSGKKGEKRGGVAQKHYTIPVSEHLWSYDLIS